MAFNGFDARKEFHVDCNDLVHANYDFLHGIRILIRNYPLLGSYKRLPGITDAVIAKPIQN